MGRMTTAEFLNQFIGLHLEAREINRGILDSLVFCAQQPVTEDRNGDRSRQPAIVFPELRPTVNLPWIPLPIPFKDNGTKQIFASVALVEEVEVSREFKSALFIAVGADPNSLDDIGVVAQFEVLKDKDPRKKHIVIRDGITDELLRVNSVDKTRKMKEILDHYKAGLEGLLQTGSPVLVHTVNPTRI